MKKPVIQVALGLSILLFIAFQAYNVKKRGNKNFQIFNNAGLKGTISKIAYSVGAVYLKLKNDNNTYSFIPVNINPNHRFYNIAEKGDSLIKPKDSDTVIILKKGKRYEFLFQKL